MSDQLRALIESTSSWVSTVNYTSAEIPSYEGVDRYFRLILVIPLLWPNHYISLTTKLARAAGGMHDLAELAFLRSPPRRIRRARQCDRKGSGSLGRGCAADAWLSFDQGRFRFVSLEFLSDCIQRTSTSDQSTGIGIGFSGAGWRSANGSLPLTCPQNRHQQHHFSCDH